MKIAGFTFIRNAVKYDYPIKEAIQSILPLCDVVIVAVGNSDDDTLSLIESIQNPKIQIIHTIWDDQLREGGKVLSAETNKALAAIGHDVDWAIYIQGDEVLHEDGYEEIQEAMQRHQKDKNIDGLLLQYRHFYGSYDYVGTSAKWYKNEIRIFKPQHAVFSFGDAQGFRKQPNEKLNVKALKAFMHHYGWVKDPRAMQKKQEDFNKLWHDDDWVKNNVIPASEFDYGHEVRQMAKFKGSHPQVMQARIARINWKFETDLSVDRSTFKDRIKNFFYYQLGIELGYKNYRKV
jgi:glycosyltransferase involved in cell wall biosynthesis